MLGPNKVYAGLDSKPKLEAFAENLATHPVSHGIRVLSSPLDVLMAGTNLTHKNVMVPAF